MILPAKSFKKGNIWAYWNRFKELNELIQCVPAKEISMLSRCFLMLKIRYISMNSAMDIETRKLWGYGFNPDAFANARLLSLFFKYWCHQKANTIFRHKTHKFFLHDLIYFLAKQTESRKSRWVVRLRNLQQDPCYHHLQLERCFLQVSAPALAA